MLLGVAAVVGEVDVVDVVVAAAGYRGEVFDGATHVVGRLECGVDGFSAEDAGLVSGFPFGFDELWCGIAFEFGFCSACCGCAYLFWVVCSPSADTFVNDFLVGVTPGATPLADMLPVSLIVFASVVTESFFVGFAVPARRLGDGFLIGVVVFTFTVSDFLLVGLSVCGVVLGKALCVVLVVLAVVGVQALFVGLAVFSGVF